MEQQPSQPDLFTDPLAIDAESLNGLRSILQKLTTYRPDNATGVKSVQNGNTVNFAVSDSETVTITTYHGEGNLEYVDYIEDRYHYEAEAASVTDYIGITATHGNTALEAQIFLLSNQRAVSILDFGAKQIPDLRTDDSVECHDFLEQFGLGGQWYGFEHRAYAHERAQMRSNIPYKENYLVDTDTIIIEDITDGLKTLLPLEGSQPKE